MDIKKPARSVTKFSIMIMLLFAAQGCRKSTGTEAEFYDFKNNVTATRLNIDVHVYDAICKSNTDMAKRILANRINSDIRELERSSRERPLAVAAKSLYETAIDYKKNSTELQKSDKQ